MADREHLKLLKLGVKEWNRWRRKHSAIEPDLQDVRFTIRSLASVNLRGANLSGAIVYEANLQGARLQDSNLSFAHFYDCDLHKADLTSATLAATEFRRTNLSEVALVDARAHATF